MPPPIGISSSRERHSVAVPLAWLSESAGMMNFLLGTVAGGLIVGIATIAAARHPEVQLRLGLIPPAGAIILPAAHPRLDPACRPATPRPAEAAVGQTDLLFARRRFWFVAP